MYIHTFVYVSMYDVCISHVSYACIYVSGLDGNKLAEVWNIARHFYLSSLKCAMNSRVDRTF